MRFSTHYLLKYFLSTYIVKQFLKVRLKLNLPANHRKPTGIIYP